MKFSRFIPLVALLVLVAIGVAPALAQETPLDYFFRAVHSGSKERAASIIQANPEIDFIHGQDKFGLTALHAAVLGQAEMVRWLLARGADPNATDRFGSTPFHHAISRAGDMESFRAQADIVIFNHTIFRADESMEIVDILLAAGANINSLDGKNFSPLHLAVGARSKIIAKLLLERGARDDASPLFDAIAHGDKARIENLLAQNPKLVRQSTPQITSKDGKTTLLSGPGVVDISLLHAAVFWGDADIVSLLLANKAALDIPNQRGEMPLHEAVNLRDIAMAELLLDSGADVNATTHFYGLIGIRSTETKITPLHFAAQSGNLEMAQLLLKRGADLNAQTTSKHTPLDWATFANQPEMVTLLLQTGAQHGEVKFNQLFNAIERRKNELARALIAGGADVNAKGHDGSTPLWQAARWGDVEMLKQLWRNGADVNALSRHDETALHAAIKFNSNHKHDDAILLLLEKNADVNVRDAKGVTPLMLAVQRTNIIIVEALLAHGADVNAADNAHHTALLRARIHEKTSDYRKIAAMLEDGGAKTDEVTMLFVALQKRDVAHVAELVTARPTLLQAYESHNSATPLEFAIRENDTAMARMLIEKGSDINAPNVLGGSRPLHLAISFDRPEIVKLLLEKGADVEATNKEGQTPIFFAYKSKTMLDLLLAKGAKTDVRDNQGRTRLR